MSTPVCEVVPVAPGDGGPSAAAEAGDAPASLVLKCSQLWGGNATTWTELVLPGLTGWVASRPHHGGAAGGDVHFVSSCGTGRITRLLLADVSGHGEEVADTGARLKDTMARYMNHIDPHRLAGRMNKDMTEVAGDSGRFATAVILTYFAPEGRLTVCNAGHPPPLIYRKRKSRWRPLAVPGSEKDAGVASAEAGQREDEGGGAVIANLPLGVLEDVGYRGQMVLLQPGDAVLVYTDCLNEASHPEKGMLGIDGLVGLLNGLDGDPAHTAPVTLIGSLLEAVQAAGYAFDDDLTAVMLRCDGPSPGATPAMRVAGVIRGLTAPLRRHPPPWPEFSRKNLLWPLLFWRKLPEPIVE